MKNNQNNVLKLIDAALSLQQAEEWEQSVAVLRKAESLNCNYAPIYLLLGINYQKLKCIENSEVCLRKSLEIDPDYGEALQTLGLMLANQDRLEEAIPLLRNSWSLDISNTQVLEALSSALLQAGDVDDAIYVLRRTWEQNREEDSGVLYGRFLIQLQLLEKAEAILREVKAVCLCPRTLAELALVLILQNKNSEAANLLEQAIELNPRFDRAWRGLAGCYARLGKPQRALEASEQALRLNSKHYRNWLAKAGVLMNLEKYDDALQSARKGIELIDLKDEEAYPVLIQLYEQEIGALLHLERFNEALQCLAQYQDQFPDMRRFAELRVNLLLLFEQYEEGLDVVLEIQKYGVVMAPAKYFLLHALGRSEEAWKFVREDLESVSPELQARRLDALNAIALEAYVRRKPEVVYSILTQLQSFFPDDPRLLNNLGFILIGRDELVQAEQLLVRVAQVPGGDKWQAITAVNLAYLYLLQSRYDEAARSLLIAEASSELQSDTEAVSRVAYWKNGVVIPEYIAYPITFYPVKFSIWANKVTLLLSREEFQDAEKLARCIIDSDPHNSLGYRMLGWVLCAQGMLEGAVEAWKCALEYAQHTDEQTALNTWLAELPCVA